MYLHSRSPPVVHCDLKCCSDRWRLSFFLGLLEAQKAQKTWETEAPTCC